MAVLGEADSLLWKHRFEWGVIYMKSVNNRVLKDDNGLEDKLQHLGLFKTSENLNSFGGLPLLPHLDLPKGGGGQGRGALVRSCGMLTWALVCQVAF